MVQNQQGGSGGTICRLRLQGQQNLTAVFPAEWYVSGWFYCCDFKEFTVNKWRNLLGGYVRPLCLCTALLFRCGSSDSLPDPNRNGTASGVKAFYKVILTIRKRRP